MISGFLNPSPSTEFNYFYFWRHQDTQDNSRKYLGHFFKNDILVNIQKLEARISTLLEAMGTEK